MKQYSPKSNTNTSLLHRPLISTLQLNYNF